MKNYIYILFAFMFHAIYAQSPEKYTASFIAEWAGDTASIETFTIDGNHVYGQALHLYPKPNLKHFSYWYNPDGSIFSMDIQVIRLEDSSLSFHQHLISSEHSAKFWLVSRDTLREYVHQADRIDFIGGWVPLFCQWEWLTQRLVSQHLSDSLKFINSIIGVYDLWLNQKNDSTIIFDSGITDPITIYLDDNKHIKYIDAIGTPWNYEIKRYTPFNVESFVPAFSKKKAIGPPSPHEKTSPTIRGVKMAFDYGRPSRRGRQIFGFIVPYNVVWRTGAGSVTRWSFDQDLDFIGTVVPAGDYNIFSVPGHDSWTLIFNNEPNAWGSAYRSEFDVYKVKMKSIPTTEIVEKFTAQIKETNQGGKLIFTWDKTQAEVDFLIKK